MQGEFFFFVDVMCLEIAAQGGKKKKAAEILIWWIVHFVRISVRVRRHKDIWRQGVKFNRAYYWLKGTPLHLQFRYSFVSSILNTTQKEKMKTIAGLPSHLCSHVTRCEMLSFWSNCGGLFCIELRRRPLLNVIFQYRSVLLTGINGRAILVLGQNTSRY